jgi:hypothetical protein
MIKLLLGLAQAAYLARENKTDFPLQVNELLAQMEEADSPLPELAAFFKDFAAGKDASIPAGLPPKINEILMALKNEAG